LADIFYSKEKFKDAAPIYRRLTQVMKDTSSNPLRAAVWFKLARTYEHLNQSSEANECYENAVELAKTTIGPLFPNLLESFLRFLKRTNAEKDRIEEIKALIENLNR
jgi:tetratricopeptide (TPR) repeat protein